MARGDSPAYFRRGVWWAAFCIRGVAKVNSNARSRPRRWRGAGISLFALLAPTHPWSLPQPQSLRPIGGNN
jgi:hypothetical protein